MRLVQPPISWLFGVEFFPRSTHRVPRGDVKTTFVQVFNKRIECFHKKAEASHPLVITQFLAGECWQRKQSREERKTHTTSHRAVPPGITQCEAHSFFSIDKNPPEREHDKEKQFPLPDVQVSFPTLRSPKGWGGWAVRSQSVKADRQQSYGS
jgi:hypothetical protein